MSRRCLPRRVADGAVVPLEDSTVDDSGPGGTCVAVVKERQKKLPPRNKADQALEQHLLGVESYLEPYSGLDVFCTHLQHSEGGLEGASERYRDLPEQAKGVYEDMAERKRLAAASLFRDLAAGVAMRMTQPSTVLGVPSLKN